MNCQSAPQQYFFDVPMFPSITDTYNNVGINNTNPEYALDVNETIRTSNLIADGIIYSSNISNTGLINTYDISASNAETVALNVRSNLYWGGHSLYDPYPGDKSDWDELIPFQGDSEGMIDISWLRKPLTAKDVITDLWNLAEGGVQVAETLKDLYDFLYPEETAIIPELLADALGNALSGGDDDPNSTDSNSIYVSWSNLKDKPIAFTNLNAGFKGDVYISNSNSLYVIDDNYIVKQGRNNLSILPNGQLHADPIIDFRYKAAYFNELNIASNMISPYISFGDSNSNVNVAGSLFSSNYDTSRINTSVIEATQFNDNVHEQSKLYYYGLGTALTHIRPPSTGILDGARINLDSYSMKFQTSCNNTSFNSYKTLMSMNYDGSLYVASNIAMSNIMSLTCNSNNNQGIFEFTPEKLRFRTSNAVSVSNLFGINSNGAFLESTPFPKIMGRIEAVEYPNPVNPIEMLTACNFARLEVSFENGLIYGTGISNNIFNTPYPNLDFFKTNRLGELYTLASDTVNMEKHINSNGEIQKNNTVIDKQGNLKVKGSNVILTDGSIQRTSNWSVSSNGIMNIANIQYNSNGIFNKLSSNLFYNPSNETVSCEYIGIGTSTPQKDLHIQSVDSFGNDPEEVGIKIQSGDNLQTANLYIVSKEEQRSTIAYSNKPLIIGRTSNAVDITNNTQSTMVFAINDNVGIKKLVPSYDLEVGGTCGACNFYENGKQLIDKYVSLTGGDITNDISLSNNATLEFGKWVVGKETNAGKIGYGKFTANALDIVGAGSNLGGRNIQLWDNINTYGTISESGTLLTTKYAMSNSLSNYMLISKPETDKTFKSIYGPGGLHNGFIVDNTNVNYGSGSAIILSTGSNWRTRVSQDTQGDGNHFKVDLSSGGNSNFINGLDIANFGGNIRATIANLYINDYGFGSNYVGVSHWLMNSNSYALLQNNFGRTYLNCSSNTAIDFTQNRTSNIATFTNTSWGIGGSITGKPDSYTGQGNGAFVKASGWKLVQNVGGSWCADVECYSSTNGIFPNNNMTQNSWNGLLSVYFSGGSNSLESAMCSYYITNVYNYGIQTFLKSTDARGLTLGHTGLVGSSTIRTTVSEQYIAFCYRFDGAA